ncbi:hypothetical protein D3C78_892370 [compost metagenome]
MTTAGENTTREGQPLGKLELAPYDLFLMTSLSPARTGIEGAVIYCGHDDDGGKRSPFHIKVSVGTAWGASRKVFVMGAEGELQGRWFAVRGSEYKKEAEVPAALLRDVRKFIELNQPLLTEWADYEGLGYDSEHFARRVKSVTE